jgi:hypothetical protein
MGVPMEQLEAAQSARHALALLEESAHWRNELRVAMCALVYLADSTHYDADQMRSAALRLAGDVDAALLKGAKR